MLLKLFVYIGFFSHMSCGPTMVYKSKNIECIANPKFVSNVSCFIKALNWNKGVAQMDCELLKPLRNLSAHVTLFKRDYANRYQPFLIDIDFNVCDVISKKNFLSYGIIALKILQRYSNVNHSCPLEGHMLARGLYIDENLLPDFPVGLYQLCVVVFENYAKMPREEYGTIKLYIEAMERVKRRSRHHKNGLHFGVVV